MAASGSGRARAPFMLAGLIALTLGLWAGLTRVGWPLPGPVPLEAHGPLMVDGFLGTVIALERAVALRRHWAFFAPGLAAAGALAAVVRLPVAPWLLVLAGAAMLANALFVLRIERSLHLSVMALGAGSWLFGNLLWASGRPVFDAVTAWAGFLVLTIVGERLELSRLLAPRRWVRRAFVFAVGLALAGIVVSPFSRAGGMRLFGAGLVALAGWLWRYDFARRGARQKGLVRFIGLTLLGGYGWLAVAGALALWHGNPVAGPLYDAILHAVFVGFVFLAIFAHAPVIVPSVVHVRLEYRPAFYAHVVLLHLSLLARLAGDLFGNFELRRDGALGNATAIVLFVALSAWAIASRAPARPRHASAAA